MGIIRLWAASAWADGKLHDAEAAALRRLINAYDDLSAENLAEAESLLEKDPDVDVAEQVAKLSPEAREGIYRAAHTIVRLDREVTEEEEEFLERLRGELKLDDAVIARIEAGY